MRHPVDQLARSDGAESGAQADPVEATRAALLRRLRDLSPNHASAIADAPRTGLAGADDERVPEGAAGRADDKPPGPDDAEVRQPPLWRHVAQLKALWADHVGRWPDARGQEPAGADRRRPDDPPGSWRGGGDQYLSPDANAQAEGVIESLQACEQAVTEILQAIEQANEYGGVLVGLSHRRKGPDRIKEKIADKLDLGLGHSPGDVAGKINDAVRYTFCFDQDTYVDGHNDVVALLDASGYTATYSKNHWLDGQQYKGINSQWRTADGGRFELQFHTRESYYAKETLTHPPYERLRSPVTSWEERLELEAFQWLVCGTVAEPSTIDQIADQERLA